MTAICISHLKINCHNFSLVFFFGWARVPPSVRAMMTKRSVLNATSSRQCNAHGLEWMIHWTIAIKYSGKKCGSDKKAKQNINLFGFAFDVHENSASTTTIYIYSCFLSPSRNDNWLYGIPSRRMRNRSRKKKMWINKWVFYRWARDAQRQQWQRR